MSHTGTVKFFDHRGYGFIACDDPERTGFEDLYFHVSELPGRRGARFIEDGTPVEFDLGTFKSPDNVVAKKIRPIVASENGGSNERK
jgi:cold shock CspA family protein